MTSEYDRLFCSLIRILYNACTQNAESKANVPMVVAGLSLFLAPMERDALRFLLATPMMNRRLQELASLKPDPNDAASMFVHVNGPNFPIDALMDEVIGRARLCWHIIPKPELKRRRNRTLYRRTPYLSGDPLLWMAFSRTTNSPPPSLS